MWLYFPEMELQIGKGKEEDTETNHPNMYKYTCENINLHAETHTKNPTDDLETWSSILLHQKRNLAKF